MPINIIKNTCIHTYVHKYIHTKMANEVEDQFENALNLVVSTTEQSSNMRKALKQKIFVTVSTLRPLFVKLKESGSQPREKRMENNVLVG
jgi:hypothetical protein